jgi:hypothetical protein
MNTYLKNSSIVAIAVIAVGFGWYQHRMSGEQSAKSEPAIASGAAQHGNMRKDSGVIPFNGAEYPLTSPAAHPASLSRSSSTLWREKTLTSAELKVHPRFWMLAYSEADKAWLEQYGYPTLEQEEKLSAASLQELRDLTAAGNLNARVNLGVRHAQAAMEKGDEKSFLLAMASLGGSIVEGGPYQAAKTMAFFSELSKNRASFGELDSEKLKGLQEKLLQTYDLARGISRAHGDFMAYQLGRDYNDDVRTRFNLAPIQKEYTFESAMDIMAKLNNTRQARGIPPYTFTLRPERPFVANGEGQPITVFIK